VRALVCSLYCNRENGFIRNLTLRIRTMTELSFAKSFLTTLDSRPNKISAEHVEDPKTYPARGAVSSCYGFLIFAASQDV
jgi:hypothetical protein